MLKIIRRVFDFGGFSRSQPNTPHPGDMLDAQFDEIIHQIDAWDARVKRVITDEGFLADGVITTTAIDPALWETMQNDLSLRALQLAETARKAASKADAAALRIEQLMRRAVAAGAQAQAAAEEISTNRNAAAVDIRYLLTQAEAVRRSNDAQAAAYVETANDVAGASAKAEAWAEASWLWAEHMPDTLPDNAVKIMDISGDHWSSRWWANRADNAFGRLTDLYLGAWPDPPTTNLEGGPITIGSIYYNTDTGQMYVWDGSNWQSMTQPQRAATAALWYEATAGQTIFPFATPDLHGQNYALSLDATEAVDTHVNGVKLMQAALSGPGDWTIDTASSTVTFARPLRAGDIVSFDILLDDTKLAPGAVWAWSLNPIAGKDGVKVSFGLTTKESPGVAVTVQRSEELLVSLDGVVQEPGVSYNASGSTISFAQAPAADAYVFITWYRPEIP